MTDRKVLLYSLLAAFVSAAFIPFFDAAFVPVIDLLPDTGASWYYWQLPDPTAATRASAWIPYVVHQVLVWFLIYRLNASKQKIGDSLSRWNWALLVVNGVFVVGHYIQTAIWYDGLAQDVSVGSSQYSVIFMLVLILIMKNRWRGLFFGKKVKLPRDGVRLTSSVHSYFIAWAAIYTFWFHPVVSEWAHVIGFFYMFLLFIQLSLARTKVHSHKVWTLALEVTVLVHGASVAFFTQDSIIWTMFFTGFGTIFIVTQIYGLGLSKATIRGASVFYVLLVLGLYSFYPDGSFSAERLANIHQFTWIPTIEYLLVFVTAGLLWAVSLVPPVQRKLHPPRA